MAPKKAKSIKKLKGALSTEDTKFVFSEIERALFELQITDCNRKLASLRTAVGEYEVRNEELQKAYDILDEDRADIIAYLKKTLNVKSEENAVLKDKIKELEELRVIETEEFKLIINELESNFTKMKDQLTSENKLLAGKINTLDEFRAIRDDLMRKFDKQERAFEDQELKYKIIIYDTEKKFVIGKDKLKKEMEGRLQQLAQQFQDASELRIAASTHRVIGENIVLNNQLDSLLLTQAKLADQNEKFRVDERAARCEKEVAEEERDKAMSKSMMQLKVIEQLTAAFEDVRKLKALYEKEQFDTEKVQTYMLKLTKEKKNLLLRIRILEQNLHAALGEQNKSVVETGKLLTERETFKNILRESAFTVQALLKQDNWSTLDPSREIMDREIILKKILEVIYRYRDAARAESMESLIPLNDMYEKGDLVFEVKSVPSRRTHETATGLAVTSSIQSFEDKRSAVSVSSILSSKASIKTIPSVEVRDLEEEEPLPIKDSLPSLIVNSSRSGSTEESEEIQDDITEITKLLAISKVEMQKSLMEDLAMSQISQPRMSVLDSKSRLDTGSQKSVETIHEEGESNVEDEQDKTVPKEDGRGPVQDKDEPIQDIDKPVTVTDKEGDEEEEKKETSAK